MLDGFKIYRLITNDDLSKNELLNFPTLLDLDTGEEMHGKRVASYKGLNFEMTNGGFKVNGSFHKFYNDGLHNYNDFNFIDLVGTIERLKDLFNINHQKTKLNGLEFGVNIRLNQNIDKVLKSIISHKKERFQKFNINGSKGVECIHQQYIIKIYNKSHQYRINDNILRIEVKVNKMQFFINRDIEIDSLSSLINPENIIKMSAVLLDVLNDIHFTDYDINKINLKGLERTYYDYGNNPDYWTTTNKTESKKHYRYIKRFREILKKYSINNYKDDLINLVGQKCNELLKINIKKDLENGVKLTVPLLLSSSKNGVKLTV